MSDTNDTKQDDTIIQNDIGTKDMDNDNSFSFSGSERVSDDIDDGDDEDGIFAAPPAPQKKKSGGSPVVSIAAAIAVVAVGGAAYYHNPDILNQVAQNFSGEGGVLETAEQIEPQVPMTAPEVPPVVADVNENIVVAAEQSVPEGAPPSPNVTEPTPEQASADSAVIEPNEAVASDVVAAQQPENAAGDLAAPTGAPMSPDANAPDAGTLAVTPQMPQDEPTMTGGMETVDLTVPADASGVPEIKVIEPVNDISASVVGAMPPPTVDESAAEKVSVVENNTEGNATAAREEASVAPAPTSAELVSAESGKTADAESTKSQVEKDAALNKALGIEEESAKAEYFDSPSGKILNSIPAPSMNPLKGKGESIIIVHGKDNVKVEKEPKAAPKKTPKGKVEISRNDIDVQIVAASRALKLGRYDAATEMYDKLYAMNPRDGRILMGRAILLQKTGQGERAIEAYEEVLKSDPSNMDAVVNLAGLIRKQYPAEALSKLLDMKSQYPSNVSVVAQLGVAYADSGNFEDAYRNLSQASLLEPQNPQHYYNMAVIAERLRDSGKAISLYEKALEVDALHGSGRGISRERIYDRLTQLRGN